MGESFCLGPGWVWLGPLIVKVLCGDFFLHGPCGDPFFLVLGRLNRQALGSAR